ncbi:MAG: DeoR/GlpR family DNA-binding transcription regulator [Ignavibacteriales bacterium]
MGPEKNGLFAEERHQRIVELLRQDNRITVSGLVDLLNVSEATIRRDLRYLKMKGLITRTHGGAILAEGTGFEPTMLEKEEQFRAEKERIGRLAAGLIEDGDTVILDGGTTTVEIARNLRNREGITVITNAINVCTELARSDMDIILIGGSLRKPTLTLVGSLAEATLKQFHVDKVFLGMNGVSVSHGLTTPNLTEAQAKRLMLEQAETVVVVADHSKIEKTSLVTVAGISEVDVLVTDDGISREQKQAFEDSGVRVLIAGAC